MRTSLVLSQVFRLHIGRLHRVSYSINSGSHSSDKILGLLLKDYDLKSAEFNDEGLVDDNSEVIRALRNMVGINEPKDVFCPTEGISSGKLVPVVDFEAMRSMGSKPDVSSLLLKLEDRDALYEDGETIFVTYMGKRYASLRIVRELLYLIDSSKLGPSFEYSEGLHELLRNGFMERVLLGIETCINLCGISERIARLLIRFFNLSDRPRSLRATKYVSIRAWNSLLGIQLLQLKSFSALQLSRIVIYDFSKARDRTQSFQKPKIYDELRQINSLLTFMYQNSIPISLQNIESLFIKMASGFPRPGDLKAVKIPEDPQGHPLDSTTMDRSDAKVSFSHENSYDVFKSFIRLGLLDPQYVTIPIYNALLQQQSFSNNPCGFDAILSSMNKYSAFDSHSYYLIFSHFRRKCHPTLLNQYYGLLLDHLRPSAGNYESSSSISNKYPSSAPGHMSSEFHYFLTRILSDCVEWDSRARKEALEILPRLFGLKLQDSVSDFPMLFLKTLKRFFPEDHSVFAEKILEPFAYYYPSYMSHPLYCELLIAYYSPEVLQKKLEALSIASSGKSSKHTSMEFAFGCYFASIIGRHGYPASSYSFLLNFLMAAPTIASADPLIQLSSHFDSVLKKLEKLFSCLENKGWRYTGRNLNSLMNYLLACKYYALISSIFSALKSGSNNAIYDLYLVDVFLMGLYESKSFAQLLWYIRSLAQQPCQLRDKLLSSRCCRLYAKFSSSEFIKSLEDSIG